jgi:8-oxo-dGTP pyrophosphatase MutT (NUDIX family)
MKRRYVLVALLAEKSHQWWTFLVRKEKPEEQRGKVNFPGGSIEECESPLQAALRELEEESKIKLEGPDLKFVTLLEGPDYEIYFYAAPSTFEALMGAVLSTRQHAESGVVSSFLNFDAQARDRTDYLDAVTDLPWLANLALARLQGQLQPSKITYLSEEESDNISMGIL